MVQLGMTASSSDMIAARPSPSSHDRSTTANPHASRQQHPLEKQDSHLSDNNSDTSSSTAATPVLRSHTFMTALSPLSPAPPFPARKQASNSSLLSDFDMKGSPAPSVKPPSQKRGSKN